jgi:hypothetical protein
MTAHHQVFSTAAPAASTSPAALSNWIGSVGSRLAAWVDTCADYYAAAAVFQQLASLSDAELARRGLSRARLARDVCAACDRTRDR